MYQLFKNIVNNTLWIQTILYSNYFLVTITVLYYITLSNIIQQLYIMHVLTVGATDVKLP